MSQNLPLVSVVIPCYNYEKFVAQAIKSVINQTYKRVQLIVVDDGSTDDSIRIIEKIRGKYGFEFIIQENKGQSAAINRGMRDYAKGKYVACLDSDDYWDVSKVEKQIQFMEKNPQYGMCYTRNYIIEGSIRKPVYKHNSFFGKSGWLFDYIFLENFIPALTVMVRKEVYDKVGLFDEQRLYVEDYDMWLRIAKQYQIGFIDEYLAYYRLHESNIHYDYDKMRLFALEVIKSWKNENLYKQALTRHYASWFCKLAGKEKKLALKHLYLAFKNSVNYCFIMNQPVFRGIIKLCLPKKVTSLITQFKRKIMRKFGHWKYLHEI